MYYRIITPSVVLPCDIAFLKSQLRVTHTAQDAYLLSLIGAAMSAANDYTGRQLNAATLMALSPYTTDHLVIEAGPVNAVTLVQYVNLTGSLVTVVNTNYTLVPRDLSANVISKDSFVFDNIDTTREDAIQITYSAGYSTFPEEIKNAVALKAARMFANPDDQVDKMDTISENLLKKYRCPII